ncbi:VOC family protein [Halosolutus gelatinilyticus]|uniref:VOC family protein n=1 Tax=Halosolutus gelatinilyticus TaxID=2931975 RepID=UPI001FF475C9|nr:VOC family protein [Halosolutus gelatinilyticus]
MLGEIDHIEIEASDAEEIADFLKKLGYEELRTTEHHGESFELEPAAGDGPIFEIHTVEGEEVPGINHIAFAVDDIEDVTDRLEEADVDSIVGPYDVEATGRTITNFRDPDGRRFQVVADND